MNRMLLMFVWPVASSSAVVVERVANYSSVTARESLENLRRRQLQQQLERRRRTGLLMSDDIDTTYDTIDYDVINAVALFCQDSFTLSLDPVAPTTIKLGSVEPT